MKWFAFKTVCDTLQGIGITICLLLFAHGEAKYALLAVVLLYNIWNCEVAIRSFQFAKDAGSPALDQEDH